MRDSDSPGGGNWFAGILAVAGGLVVFIGCAYHVLRGIFTGMTPGRLGAVHFMPEPSYFVSIGAGILGIVLGTILMRLGWRWLHD